MALSHCLAETMLTYHQRCSVAFIWEQFRRRSWTLSVIYVHNICSKYIYASKTTATSPRGQWIKCTYFYYVSYWHKWHIDTILWRWHWQPYHSFLPKAWKNLLKKWIYICLKGYAGIFVQISMKCIPWLSSWQLIVYYIVVWHQTDDNPWSEPLMTH